MIKEFKKLYGVGESSLYSFRILFGLNSRYRLNNFNQKTKRSINQIVDKLTHKNSLKLKLLGYRKFTVEVLKNYKGVRHNLRYPVRGQRTHSNAKTRKRLKSSSQKDWS